MSILRNIIRMAGNIKILIKFLESSAILWRGISTQHQLDCKYDRT